MKVKVTSSLIKQLIAEERFNLKCEKYRDDNLKKEKLLVLLESILTYKSRLGR